MKTIVIPDVHQRTKFVQYILDAETDYDEVVFLGDWFDSFFDPPIVSGFEDTCKYLKSLILEHENKDKFVFLLGNHDLCYISENKNFSNKQVSRQLMYYCSGFTTSKAKKFRHQFFDKNLRDDFFIKNFKIAHQTQGWVLSHAGIQIEHLPYWYDIDRFVNQLLPDVWKNFRNLEYNHNCLLSGVGLYRGGNYAIGGVLWCDWNVEFRTHEKLGKQILGHTKIEEPAVIDKDGPNETWNLDTEKDYGVIINGEMSTKHIDIATLNKKH